MEEREGRAFSLGGMIYEGTFSTRSLYTAAIQQVDSFVLFCHFLLSPYSSFSPNFSIAAYYKICFSIQLSTTADKLSCSHRMNYILSYSSTFNENAITLPEEFPRPFSVMPPSHPTNLLSLLAAKL